jgi:hypothetical protein
VVAGDKAGKMPALQVAKKYQKSGICASQWNYLKTQTSDKQSDA